jgi:hypothetical protein
MIVRKAPTLETNEFANCYEDTKRAEAYAKLEFAGTYYLAYRDLRWRLQPLHSML